MAFSFSRWRAPQLLLAWLVYWVSLAVITLRPALSNALVAVRAPQGHGTISSGINNGVMSLTVKSDQLIYTGSASLMTIAFWIAVPPLLLWVFWFATRTRPVAERERVL
jgi:hypothetical protein